MCGCLSRGLCQGPSLQPRLVPWLGIKPTTLWFVDHTQSTELHQPGHNTGLKCKGPLICRFFFPTNACTIFDLQLEVCRSMPFYIWGLSILKYAGVPESTFHGYQGYLRLRRVKSYMCSFGPCEGSVLLTSALFKGELYYLSTSL